MSEESTQQKIGSAFRSLLESRERILKLGLFTVLLVGLGLLFPRGESVELEYRVGGVWANKDLIAPFSFPILRDERELARDLDEARRKVHDVYERDTMAAERQLGRLSQFLRQLSEAVALREQYRRSFRRHAATLPEDSARFVKASGQLDIPFTDREWETLASPEGATAFPEIEATLSPLFRSVLTVGLLDSLKGRIRRSEIAVRTGTTEEIVPAGRYYDRNDLLPLLEGQIRRTSRTPTATGQLAYKIGVTFLMPNVRFSEAATLQARLVAEDAVPRTLGFHPIHR